jgi:hypothetical protein
MIINYSSTSIKAANTRSFAYHNNIAIRADELGINDFVFVSGNSPKNYIFLSRVVCVLVKSKTQTITNVSSFDKS